MAIKLSDKQKLFARNIHKLEAFIFKLGFEITYGEATRHQIVQDLYLKEGKTTAKYSQHQKKLARDYNFFYAGKYITGKNAKKMLQVVGDYWESLHPDNRWGGNWTTFVDTPHFEMRG